jgi:hypothetical protein
VRDKVDVMHSNEFLWTFLEARRRQNETHRAAKVSKPKISDGSRTE